MQKKNFLMTLNKTLFTIKRRLLDNAKLRKLLYYTTADALLMDDPLVENLENYIYLETIVKGSNDDAINNFITIDLDRADTSYDSNIGYTFSIKAYCSLDNIKMDSDVIRYYAIAQEIIETLDDKSVNTDGKLNLTEVRLITVEDLFVGLDLTFLTIDSTSVDEFS